MVPLARTYKGKWRCSGGCARVVSCVGLSRAAFVADLFGFKQQGQNFQPDGSGSYEMPVGLVPQWRSGSFDQRGVQVCSFLAKRCCAMSACSVCVLPCVVAASMPQRHTHIHQSRVPRNECNGLGWACHGYGLGTHKHSNPILLFSCPSGHGIFGGKRIVT